MLLGSQKCFCPTKKGKTYKSNSNPFFLPSMLIIIMIYDLIVYIYCSLTVAGNKKPILCPFLVKLYNLENVFCCPSLQMFSLLPCFMFWLSCMHVNCSFFLSIEASCIGPQLVRRPFFCTVKQRKNGRAWLKFGHEMPLQNI